MEIKYLDLDNRVLYDTEDEFNNAMSQYTNPRIKTFTNEDWEQTLVVGSNANFTELHAVTVCRKISGVQLDQFMKLYNSESDE